MKRRWYVVESVEAAATLTDTKALRHLAPFMGSERTVGEVASELAMSPQAMYYWVQKFCSRGLLVVTREMTRRGKALKVYTASAERYFIPLEVVPATTLEALAMLRDEPWAAQFTRNLVAAYHDAFRQLHTWGVCIVGTDGHGVHVDLAPATDDETFLSALVRRQDMPAVLSCWVPLQLDFGDAKALQQELDAVVRRYRQKRGAQTYLAHLAMAPIVGE